ncbi:MAG: flagellar basal body rod protein FlgB [Candidatus Gastranaerophilales bacterium]|nr:flagellar basal body rod protein FlgB [Candidatus Gastranaerophilales bacterium]
MDFTSNTTSKIVEKAMDGLSARQKAISANIANSQTDNYTRVDVQFEDQLKNIMANERMQEQVKLNNSYASLKPMSVNVGILPNSYASDVIMEADNFKSFAPEDIIDTDSPVISSGNNVNIEAEMVELAKNSSKYNVLAQLQSKYFKKMEDQFKSASTL